MKEKIIYEAPNAEIEILNTQDVVLNSFEEIPWDDLNAASNADW